MTRLYTTQLIDGYSSITCKLCGLTSFNHNDVLELYCGNCHIFHDNYTVNPGKEIKSFPCAERNLEKDYDS